MVMFYCTVASSQQVWVCVHTTVTLGLFPLFTLSLQFIISQLVSSTRDFCSYVCIFIAAIEPISGSSVLLTLSMLVQQGLWYLVCVCVCVFS